MRAFRVPLGFFLISEPKPCVFQLLKWISYCVYAPGIHFGVCRMRTNAAFLTHQQLSTCEPQLRTPNQSPIKPKHKNKPFSPELKDQLPLQNTYIYLKKKKTPPHSTDPETPLFRCYNSSITSYLQHVWDPKPGTEDSVTGSPWPEAYVTLQAIAYTSTYNSIYQHTISNTSYY